MKKESLNINIQLLLLVGIPLIGAGIGYFFDKSIIIDLSAPLGPLALALFHFFGKIYMRGHWYSKIERIGFGIFCLILAICGFFLCKTYR